MALAKRFRLDHVAQVDGVAVVVGHLDADVAGARHAFDEDAFGAHGKAEIVAQAGYAAVFDAGVGLEFVGGDHGAGVDLDHLAIDFELRAFLDQLAGFLAQNILADGQRLFAFMEQGAGREPEAVHFLGRDGHGALGNLWMRVGALLNLKLRRGPGARGGRGSDRRNRCEVGIETGEFFRDRPDFARHFAHILSRPVSDGQRIRIGDRRIGHAAGNGNNFRFAVRDWADRVRLVGRSGWGGWPLPNAGPNARLDAGPQIGFVHIFVGARSNALEGRHVFEQIVVDRFATAESAEEAGDEAWLADFGFFFRFFQLHGQAQLGFANGFFLGFLVRAIGLPVTPAVMCGGELNGALLAPLPCSAEAEVRAKVDAECGEQAGDDPGAGGVDVENQAGRRRGGRRCPQWAWRAANASAMEAVRRWQAGRRA